MLKIEHQEELLLFRHNFEIGYVGFSGVTCVSF